MTVWIVIKDLTGGWERDDHEVVGVFSSEELAKEYCAKTNAPLDWHEFEVDKLAERGG